MLYDFSTIDWICAGPNLRHLTQNNILQESECRRNMRIHLSSIKPGTKEMYRNIKKEEKRLLVSQTCTLFWKIFNFIKIGYVYM